MAHEECVSSPGNNLETHKMLTLSTAHFKLSDREIFENIAKNNNDLLLDVYDFKYGYLIRRITKEHIPRMRGIGFSDALLKVIAFALKNGFDMIEFDCDGHTVEGLEEFSW